MGSWSIANFLLWPCEYEPETLIKWGKIPTVYSTVQSYVLAATGFISVSPWWFDGSSWDGSAPIIQIKTYKDFTPIQGSRPNAERIIPQSSQWHACRIHTHSHTDPHTNVPVKNICHFSSLLICSGHVSALPREAAVVFYALQMGLLIATRL